MLEIHVYVMVKLIDVERLTLASSTFSNEWELRNTCVIYVIDTVLLPKNI